MNASPRKEKLKKVARVLLALGEEKAAEVLSHLDDQEIEPIMAEILAIDGIDESERFSILKEFEREIEKNSGSLMGGHKVAKDLLIQSLGEQKADRFLKRIDNLSSRGSFKRLEEYPADIIAKALDDELSQTCALVLSSINAKHAARVLALLEQDKRASIARRIATMQKINSDSIKVIAEALEKKIKKMQVEETHTTGGAALLSEILNHMDLDSEEAILSSMNEHEPELADKIRENLVSFENILQLSGNEIRRVVERLPDTITWAMALKGAGADLVKHVLGSLSINRSSDILDEINHLGAVNLQQINENRRKVLRIAEELDRSREITLRKHKEKMVD